MIAWFLRHWIEAFGMITGFLYIYLEIKENIWLWPVGIISGLFYIVVFFSSGFYADMSMQVYYVIVSVYGWILWAKKNGQIEQLPLKISHTPKKIYFYLIFVSITLWIIIYFILKILPGAAIPFWDAFTTAFSITATWMLAKKYIEQWILWIFIDFISAILYVYKGLYFTSILFIVFTIFAYVGYRQWKKLMLKPIDV